MQVVVFLLVILSAMSFLPSDASPWSRSPSGKSRTFSDLLRFPSDHNPWHNVLTREMEPGKEVEKKAKSFSELPYFPRGHNPWRDALAEMQQNGP